MQDRFETRRLLAQASRCKLARDWQGAMEAYETIADNMNSAARKEHYWQLADECKDILTKENDNGLN